jgi:Fe-S cluster biogenesis protein NfuA
MFVQVQETPNPHTMKFVPGVEVLKNGVKSFITQEEAVLSPLAAGLLKIEGVKGVFLTPDFITVTKSAEHDWQYLKTIVLSSIVDHFVGGMPVYLYEMEEDGQTTNEGVHGVAQKILEMIESRVRPAVAQDGGDIEFSSFDDKTGTVYVRLQGACSGCPSSTITLKDGIERMLKHYIPEVQAVEALSE